MKMGRRPALSGAIYLSLVILGCALPGHGIESISILSYNVQGNGVDDWSTNSPQVQAIGRQMSHLQPDIATLQEVPFTNTWQMADFVRAYLPGYALATNSGTDGHIRSVILSRYPIVRSQSRLDGITLEPFGSSGSFTRDLFEAEIHVPTFAQPLHVFTTHLKAGQDAAGSARRAAEARAISNYLVTTFLRSHPGRPYVLAGDLNEDLDRPPASNPGTILTLISPSTGLRLTTPVHPLTHNELTWSTRSGYTKRFDYVLPNGLLYSNLLNGQVFRSDILANPPPPLRTSDTRTASDHAPVLVVFGNPYNTPFRLVSVSVANQAVILRWESAPSRQYSVEASANLTTWTCLASNLPASGSTLSFTTKLGQGARFFRVRRVL